MIRCDERLLQTHVIYLPKMVTLLDLTYLPIYLQVSELGIEAVKSKHKKMICVDLDTYLHYGNFNTLLLLSSLEYLQKHAF